MKRWRSEQLARGQIRASVWEVSDGVLVSAYLPVGTKGHPDGLLLFGGYLGAHFPDWDSAMSAANEQLSEFDKTYPEAAALEKSEK